MLLRRFLRHVFSPVLSPSLPPSPSTSPFASASLVLSAASPHRRIHPPHDVTAIVLDARAHKPANEPANLSHRIASHRTPVVGWVPVADSMGYVLLAKGGPDAGRRWRYRVVCREGAIVRQGLELNSQELFSLPSHSIVEVSGS